MNDSRTIEKRMQKAGLPYEITNMETPEFMLSGKTSVVAIWKDSTNDNTRAFIGFYDTIEGGAVARQALKVRGCYSAYVVNAVSK